MLKINVEKALVSEVIEKNSVERTHVVNNKIALKVELIGLVIV